MLKDLARQNEDEKEMCKDTERYRERAKGER